MSAISDDSPLVPVNRRRSLFAVLLFLALSSQALSQGTQERVYMLNDYDYNTGDWYNDFFGNHGVWEYSSAHCTITYPQVAGYHHELRLDYDVTAPSSAGGWWELFTYSYSDPNTPMYDLSSFSDLRFSVRAAPGSTSRLYIEFVQGNYEKIKRVEITGITGTMKEYTISLATALSGFDRKRMKSVASVIENGHATALTGTLFFDNLYFTASEPVPATDDALLDLISKRAFRYFLECVHPATGLVRDKASSTDVTSIAAVGFQLAALGIGAERSWITRSDAAARTRQMLRTLLHTKHDASASGSIGYKGFFYHMLDLPTATRAPGSELSSIDASLGLAGVIFAREYFDAPLDPVEAEIRRLGDSLYLRFDWQWMLNSARNIFYMAWYPESGYDLPQWDYLTDETTLICLLAIGSGSVDPAVFYAWSRTPGSYHGATHYQTWWGSLFTYFFAQCWIPGKQLGLDHGSPTAVNWWENSRAAALTDRQFCIDSSGRYMTYSMNSWGLTACFGPTGYNGGFSKSYGAQPLADAPANHDGTIAPYGAGSCLPFFSEDPSKNEAMAALRNFYYNYPKLWGIYGLKDAFNLGTRADTTDDWYTDDYVGIDSGPLLVMIENYRSGLVWKYFSRNAQINNALRQVFQDTATFTSAGEINVGMPQAFRLEQNFPNPFNPTTVVSSQLPVVSNVKLVVYD
ncbi:DUF3131 domain-containing protein, partial [bacterium]